LFNELSRQYHWTPDEIRWLTLQELEIYTSGNQRYRENVAPIDLSLEKIRRAIFSYFGIKEADRPEVLEQKIDKTAQAKVTASAKNAWIVAGMPSPAGPWLAQYRKEHENG